ncbi:MAG: hypothetical protein ACI4QL_05400, partial [Candidatus Fimimonas sp.]
MNRTAIAATTLLIILAACTAFAFLISVTTLGVNIGSYKDFENDADYVTFQAKVYTFVAYENSYYIELNHNVENFNIGFDITNENFALAKENGLSADSLHEDDVVTVTVAKNFVGANWNRAIVAISANGTEYLTFAQGKANLVAHQKQMSETSSRVVLITGIL